MTTAVGVVTTAVDAALGAEWWRCSDVQVREAVVGLERQASRLEAARLRLLAEADARRVGGTSGAVSTAEWFSAETGTRRERAGERVALAGALNSDLAATGTALGAGALTVDHALVVHRTMSRLARSVDAETRGQAEEFLVAQAEVLDPRQLARVGRVLRHRLDEKAGESPASGRCPHLAREEDVAVVQREFTCTQDDDGTWHIAGTLDAVGGATLTAALDPLSAPTPAVDGLPDQRCASRRHADGLVQLADAFLAGQAGPESSRPRLVVSVPAATLQRPTAPGTAPGLLPSGAPVSASTVGMLACDAEVVPVLVATDGSPLDVGRTVYAFPDKIRRAILARDGGCTYRGCTRPASWCQVHLGAPPACGGLAAYSTGGTTSERNGTCLCGFHHRLVHRQGWRGELVGAHVVWHPPDRTHPSVPPPPWLPALDRLVDQWIQRAA